MVNLIGLIILIVLGVFFGFLFTTWNYLRSLAQKSGESFEGMFHLFQKRQNCLPFLYQMVLEKDAAEKALLQKMIKRRAEEMQMDHNNMRLFLKDELVFRHYLETLLTRAEDQTKIKKETDFLEAKKRVLEVQKKIEREEKRYNKWARQYNEGLKRRFFWLAKKVFGLEELVVTEE